MLKFVAAFLLLISGVAAMTLTEGYRKGEICVRKGGTQSCAARAEDPEQYASLIAYKWGETVLPLVGAGGLFYWGRRLDRLNPMHPQYPGSKAFKEEDL